MSSYVKIWTDTRYDAWFLGLDINERSVWLQLLIWAKEQQDHSKIVTKMSGLGENLGCDLRTARKIVTKLHTDGKIILKEPFKGIIEIEIPKYEYYQRVKDVNSSREKTKLESAGLQKYSKNADYIDKIREDKIREDKNIMSDKSDDSASFEKRVIEWKTKQVHAWYCEAMERDPNQYKLSDARKKKIMSRLQEFKISELWAAITALSWSDWHMGQNDKQQKYNDLIDNLFKSYEQTDKWLQKYIDTQGDGKEIEEIERNINRTIESKRAGKAEVSKSVQGQPPINAGTTGNVADGKTSTT
jgi:hypothetical protein